MDYRWGVGTSAFMHSLDDLIVKSLRKSTYKPKFIYKYVDDFISEIRPDKIEYFVDILNKYHNRIKFTYELEENNALNYLDIKIIQIENVSKRGLKFDWYQKEISSSRLLNYVSHHPEIQKVNVATNFIRTVMKLSDAEFHNVNSQKIRNCLTSMNYPKKLVEKLIKDVICKMNHQQQQQMEQTAQRNLRHHSRNIVNETTEKRYIGVKYVHKLSENIVKIFKNRNIDVNIAHSSGNNFSGMYGKHKYKYDKSDTKDTVYQIKCKGNPGNACDKTYIGTSGRPLKTRMKEHEKDQMRGRTNQNSHTALVEHAVTEHHSFDTTQPKILCQETNYRKRMLLESFHIFTGKKTVNFRQDTEGI